MRAAPFLIFAAAVLGGCSSSSPTATAAAPRLPRKVSYVRFLNLTDAPLDGFARDESRSSGLEPKTLSAGSVISLSEQKFELRSPTASGSEKGEPTPGHFLTVVGTRRGGKLAIDLVPGGECTLPEKDARIELANFTSRPIDAKIDGQSVHLKPKESKAQEQALSLHTITAAGTQAQKVTPDKAEIWVVYYIESGGRVESKAVRVRASMMPTVQGSSPTG